MASYLEGAISSKFIIYYRFHKFVIPKEDITDKFFGNSFYILNVS
jgi:hypothetical protein